MPSYKLIYWNGRGRGELPRLVFAAAGEKYEDFRFDEKQWPSIKPATPFGVAPVLEVDGNQLPDSLSIAKYLANKFGLAGSGEWEQALVDSILQTTADMIGHSATIFYAEEAQKGPLTKKLLDEILPQFFEHMEKFIEKNGKDGYVVGSKMTVADLALFNTIDLAEHTYKAGTLDKSARFPKVKAVCDKVANHEKISPYLKERPVSAF